MDWIVELLWHPRDMYFFALGILAATLNGHASGWLRARRRSEPKCPNCGTILGYNGQCLVCWQRELWPQPTQSAPSSEVEAGKGGK